MLEIKHTLCPSCSVGCGINVILDGEEIVGTFPYKRHPVNAGKNCLNGRNSIDCFKDKLENVDLNKAIADASNEIKSANASDVTVICSGNDTVEEIEVIKDEIEEYPILLLDDFMSELDDKRRKNFLNNIKDIQVIITCTEKIILENLEYFSYNAIDGNIKEE